MPHVTRAHKLDDGNVIQKYYLDILSCMPNIVYWLDENCILEGCNTNFLQMMHLKKMSDCVGMSYVKMAKLAHWSPEQTMTFYRKDKEILLSGKASVNMLEEPISNQESDEIYYEATRIPLFDDTHKIIGLVVILVDITEKIKQQAGNITQQNVSMPFKTTLPKVLLIEDSFVSQKVTEKILTALNCIVDIAESEDEAMILFEPGKYNLILMDIGLENASGYMVAKKFREMEKDTQKHVPIIALTAYEADVVKEDCHAFGMEGVLAKPLTGEQAKLLIQRYVYHQDIAVRGLKTANKN